MAIGGCLGRDGIAASGGPEAYAYSTRVIMNKRSVLGSSNCRRDIEKAVYNVDGIFSEPMRLTVGSSEERSMEIRDCLRTSDITSLTEYRVSPAPGGARTWNVNEKASSNSKDRPSRP